MRRAGSKVPFGSRELGAELAGLAAKGSVEVSEATHGANDRTMMLKGPSISIISAELAPLAGFENVEARTCELSCVQQDYVDTATG